ncbi:hypothetical protein [Frigoriflavimonas asaccharolytica]|uniref:Uncharacterized protein n=1 Tax=Frigoriflavimonas asaccharolytica TaxID=2735899 RepID=A0A8J8K7S9_9FLAO|nr:hypothetical protein [Frigoriflavimonas asaccharolytica]NRS91801.1 hypothetical protein [Frigoriflavimonas asaccharolytica]
MQDLQKVKAALAPYLQGLTDKEKQSLFKMGDKTVATVQKVKSYTSTNPEFNPNYMDLAEFVKDEIVVTQLDPLVNLCNQLASDLSDTMTLAGSEALKASLMYYGAVKEAESKGVATAKPIYDDLSQRFMRQNFKKDKPKD